MTDETATQTEATETSESQTTPLDNFFDEGGDFADILKGTYCFAITNISKFKRDKGGILRAEFELTIKGDVIDGDVVESDYDGRKVWENGSLEGEQITYFTAKILRAFRERNPSKAVYIDDVPFLSGGKLENIVVPEGGESKWENYLLPFLELDVIISLRINEKETAKGYGTKYYKNFPKDQSAGLDVPMVGADSEKVGDIPF